MGLSETLAEMLQKYHITQRRAADRAGISYVTLNRILNDYRFRATRETIEKIAKGIGCTKEDTDELLRAAGRVPEDIESKFGESTQAAKLFRRMSKLDSDKMEEIDRLLDELEKKERKTSQPKGGG